jgi:hypothetical protein
MDYATHTESSWRKMVPKLTRLRGVPVRILGRHFFVMARPQIMILCLGQRTSTWL